jgi:hypothetical protein
MDLAELFIVNTAVFVLLCAVPWSLAGSIGRSWYRERIVRLEDQRREAN